MLINKQKILKHLSGGRRNEIAGGEVADCNSDVVVLDSRRVKSAVQAVRGGSEDVFSVGLSCGYVDEVGDVGDDVGVVYSNRQSVHPSSNGRCMKYGDSPGPRYLLDNRVPRVSG